MIVFIEKIFIWLHNFSYKAISRIAIKKNNRIHPKHEILKYHDFFIKNINAEDLVLDIGCGSGILAYKIAQKAKKAVAIDNSIIDIKKANKNYLLENLKFVHADATDYDFAQKFDKIVLSNVLEHIEDRDSFLSKLHKLSKTILIRVPLINRDWLAVYKKKNGYEYRLDKTHFIEYTVKSLKNELDNANWKLDNYSIQFGELWGEVINNE